MTPGALASEENLERVDGTSEPTGEGRAASSDQAQLVVSVGVLFGYSVRKLLGVDQSVVGQRVAGVDLNYESFLLVGPTE